MSSGGHCKERQGFICFALVRSLVGRLLVRCLVDGKRSRLEALQFPTRCNWSATMIKTFSIGILRFCFLFVLAIVCCTAVLTW